VAQLSVRVVAKDQAVWSGAVKVVSAPAADGEIGILAGHTPILSVLNPGKVRLTDTDGNKLEFVVSGGFLSVDADEVTIVADRVEQVSPVVA